MIFSRRHLVIGVNLSFTSYSPSCRLEPAHPAAVQAPRSLQPSPGQLGFTLTMKFSVGLPLVFSMAAFALALVALLAGKEPGTLEEYHIVLFNTSTLGHEFITNLVSGDDDDASSTSATPTPTPTSTDDDDGGIGGWFSSIKASATAIAGSLESEAAGILNDIGNDVADKLADELGIEQFYSLHVMNMCEGSYAPNATASNAWQNVTNCTTPMDFCEFAPGVDMSCARVVLTRGC